MGDFQLDFIKFKYGPPPRCVSLTGNLNANRQDSSSSDHERPYISKHIERTEEGEEDFKVSKVVNRAKILEKKGL